jgi:hypothetical protein
VTVNVVVTAGLVVQAGFFAASARLNTDAANIKNLFERKPMLSGQVNEWWLIEQND